MRTNSVDIDSKGRRNAGGRASCRGAVGFEARVWMAAAALLGILAGGGLRAAPELGEWIPLFKGVDRRSGTNLVASSAFRNRQVMHVVRVDLSDPDVQLVTTPRLESYVVGQRETPGLTVSRFLARTGVQVAINANFFDPQDYYLPEGTPMDVRGLQVSEGVVVSPQDNAGTAVVLGLDERNRPEVIPDNWPPTDTSRFRTAVAGNDLLVTGGKNVATPRGFQEVAPRTALGHSADGRYLYLLVVDGRQGGYSDGASLPETAEWLLLLGASEGVNMDGGGSTTLVMQDSTGSPLRLNRPSAVADSGRERTLGSHLGVIARPLEGFFRGIEVTPDDTTARIRWRTASAATSGVEWGATRELGFVQSAGTAAVTGHEVTLEGLSPSTPYYFRLSAVSGGVEQFSEVQRLVTTFHATTNVLVEMTNAWRYAAGDLGAVDWRAAGYDDGAWEGPSPGLLWIDIRAVPNENVQPKGTELPVDPASGFPHVTYHFRTRLAVREVVPGSLLQFSCYIDDGAVFYLNGVEVRRIRVPEGAGDTTLASGTGCDGDATCLEEFVVSGADLAPLVAGENVIAVALHNFNPRSGDVTFGTKVSLVVPDRRSLRLEARLESGRLHLSWDGSGWVLQSSPRSTGPWEDVAGQASNVYQSDVGGGARFFRLNRGPVP